MKERFEHRCTLYSFMELKILIKPRGSRGKSDMLFDVPRVGKGLALVVG
jgi:hypothetical protein